MTTVLTFGTFDLLHPGHLNYFQQAKRHGNKLIVIVARDKTKQLQNKPLLFNEKERLHLIQNLKIVDQALLGSLNDKYTPIKKIKPDIVCLGHDHKITIAKLKADLNQLNLHPQIKRMKAYKRSLYRSSKYKLLSLR